MKTIFKQDNWSIILHYSNSCTIIHHHNNEESYQAYLVMVSADEHPTRTCLKCRTKVPQDILNKADILEKLHNHF